MFVVLVTESGDDLKLSYVHGVYDTFADACKEGIEYMLYFLDGNIPRYYYPMWFDVIECETNTSKPFYHSRGVWESCNGWSYISLEDFERMKPCLLPP